jgi:hypothetical protein
MKQAFVLQLGAESDSPTHHFVGLIEEVDTGVELRFKSTDELLAFLAECFETARQRQREQNENCPYECKERANAQATRRKSLVRDGSRNT